MPPSASWAPTSAARNLLKPATPKPTRASSTTMAMIQMSMGVPSRSCAGPSVGHCVGHCVRRCVGHCVGHQEPPPPPPPPPPPENPPPPLLLWDWVAWYAEIELETVEEKSWTIELM